MEDFKNKIGLTIDTMLIKDGEELQDDDIIITGTEFLVDNTKTYQLAVTGDMTRNGEITITDVSKVKLHYIGLELLNSLEQKAADVNGDGEITITDVSKVKLHYIGLEPINK